MIQKEDNNTLQDLLANEQETNAEQNLDLVKLKEELEALKEGQAERDCEYSLCVTIGIVRI